MTPHAINWFEIPATDMDRATRFYETVLDLQLKREVFGGLPHAVFPYEKDVISGAIVKGDHLTPGTSGPCIYLNAEGKLDEAVRRVEQAGGKLLLPRTPIGEQGFIAMFTDTEGNRVALHAMK
jgi:hypothetical protein